MTRKLSARRSSKLWLSCPETSLLMTPQPAVGQAFRDAFVGLTVGRQNEVARAHAA